jgi:outer membrane protein OmpA-like peptidoglycan-associated protein
MHVFMACSLSAEVDGLIFLYLTFTLCLPCSVLNSSNETEDKPMAEDWSVDVRKYVPDADPGIIAGIVRHCGIALQSRDASLVSFTDKTETGRVRESFLKKKLGLTASDADLDSAIASVGEQMKADRTKNRVTVYYLLAERFGKLAMFGKPLATGAELPVVEKSEGPGIATLGKAGLAAGAMAAAGGFGGNPSSAGGVSPSSPRDTGGVAARAFASESEIGAPVAKSGLMRWLPWLVLAAALLLLFLYLGMHMRGATAASNTPVVPATTPAADLSATPAVTSPAAIPTGAGVATEVRDGKPAVIVYFDTGKADVVPAFGAAAASLKSYLGNNAGSKLAISGFNDKTGNAAANAELSKNRAKAVQTALVSADIPASSIELIKPSDATDTGAINAEARRVEVVVK